MTIEQSVGAGVGVLSFVGSAAIQAAEGNAANGITVPVISAIVGAAISYGILRGTVKALEKNHDDMARELHSIRDTVYSVAEKVARIEGTMERRGQPRT